VTEDAVIPPRFVKNAAAVFFYGRKYDISWSMIIAARGEKSIPPVAGRMRRMGDRIGSVM